MKNNKFNYFVLKNVKRIPVQKVKAISIIVCLVILVAAIVFAVRNQALQTVIAQATTVKPEPFTELYFENHTKLPTELAHTNQFTWYSNPTTNLYTFSFTIHNLENKDMIYPYEVYSLGLKNNKTVIDEGALFIKNNESKTMTENFVLSTIHSKTEVVVNLTNKDQQIFFWIGEQK